MLNTKDMAEIFKALGDETRLKIVQLLYGKALCVCDIIEAFSMSQPAISHHLKILKQAGIVVDGREGKWIYYQLNPETWEVIFDFVSEVNPQGVDIKRYRPNAKCQL